MRQYKAVVFSLIACLALLATLIPSSNVAPAAGVTATSNTGGATLQAQEILEHLERGTARSDFQIKQRIDYFRAKEGETMALVAFEVGLEGLTFAAPAGDETENATPVVNFKAFGNVIRAAASEEEEDEVVHEFGTDFNIEAGSGSDGFSDTRSLAMSLAPGTYTLAWGLLDNGSQLASADNHTIEIPDFGSSPLGFTSILVGTGMQQAAGEIRGDQVYRGVRFATMLVDVDIDSIVSIDDTLEIVYSVVGAETDNATMRPKLEVSYRFLRASDDENMGRFPAQTLQMDAINQPVPLNIIRRIQPGGDYKIEIGIKDLIGGSEIMQLVDFHVASAEG